MREFFKNEAFDKAVIASVGAELGNSFPVSFVEFLLQCNGGEGKDENGRYIAVWRCEDIPQYNKDYSVQKYFPKEITAFGADGDYGYFFDCRVANESKIVGCGLGALDISEIKHEAASFAEFIKAWL